MQARWDRNAIRNWGRTEAAAAARAAAAAAINVQRTHETRYFYSTPRRIYTLFGLNVIIASASATLLLHQDGFCQLDFDSGALQVFVRLEWEPGKVDEVKRGSGDGGNWTQQRQPSRSYCTSFLCISYKTTHAACGAVFGSLSIASRRVRVNLTRRGQHQSGPGQCGPKTQDPRAETGVSNRRRCRCSKWAYQVIPKHKRNYSNQIIFMLNYDRQQAGGTAQLCVCVCACEYLCICKIQVYP